MQSLGRALPLRRDPAPSRWAYRMQRLWLTPLFRVGMRVGLPAFLILLVLAIYLSNADRRAAAFGVFSAARESVAERPMFMVRLLLVVASFPTTRAGMAAGTRGQERTTSFCSIFRQMQVRKFSK